MALTTFIDMHVHTTSSDGQLAPGQMVELAAQLGLGGVAITDHDTVAGVAEAQAAASAAGIKLLPGIEISTVAEGKDIHVLGYLTDNTDERWVQRIAKLGATREGRNELLIARLNELGIPLTMEEVRAISGEQGSLGRPHFAEALIRRGVVESKQQAFDEYLGERGKAFVQPLRIHPTEAYQWIREAGGVCVLAHPGIYGDDQLVEQLLQAKPDGVEINHSDHTPEQVAYYSELAARYGLLATAGSDFHGYYEHGESFHGSLGAVVAELNVYEQIYQLHQQRAIKR